MVSTTKFGFRLGLGLRVWDFWGFGCGILCRVVVFCSWSWF